MAPSNPMSARRKGSRKKGKKEPKDVKRRQETARAQVDKCFRRWKNTVMGGQPKTSEKGKKGGECQGETNSFSWEEMLSSLKKYLQGRMEPRSPKRQVLEKAQECHGAGRTSQKEKKET